MSTKTKEPIELRAVTLDMANITPDPEQPRKNFNPERLAELMASIEKYGIINPLVVEELGKGKFMLVDGERRYRAAIELGLKKVPALIRPAMEETERIIQQFHIQEQHEGWSATEKAVAVGKLADRLGVTYRSLAQMLSLPQRTISDYLAFSELLEKDTFIKNEIPVVFAPKILNLRNFTKKVFLEELNLEFTKKQEEKLEKSIIRRIKAGDIKIARDITKIRDSVKADPKAILKFIESDSSSVNELFIKTDAKRAYAYRNVLASCRQIRIYGSQVQTLGAEGMFSDTDKKIMQSAREMLATLATK